MLRLNAAEDGSYASWHRWSKKYDWGNRAEAYDSRCDRERQTRLAAEEQERCEAYRRMLGKVAGIVDRKLDTIKPEDLSAMQTMDLLDRSWELGGKVHRKASGKEEDTPSGQLEISFADTFDGL